MRRGLKVSEIDGEIIRNYLTFKVKADSILLLGPPGIGKTEMVRRAAEKCAAVLGKEFIDYARFSFYSAEEQREIVERAQREKGGPFFFLDMNLQTRDPVDFYGRPASGRIWSGGREMEVTDFLPPRAVAYFCQYPGIIFIDEITNVHRPDLLSAAMRLTQERKVSDYALSPQVMIIMAGNRPEQSLLARALPEPFINRCLIYDVEPAGAPEWFEYILDKYGEEVDVAAAGYLSSLAAAPQYPSEEQREAMLPFPTPRSCEKLLEKMSQLSRLGDSPYFAKNAREDWERRLAVACIGEKEGLLFSSWRRSREQIEECRKNPEMVRNFSPSVLCGLSAIIGRNMTAAAEGSIIRDVILKREELLAVAERVLKRGAEYANIILLSGGIIKSFAGGEISAEDLVAGIKRFGKVRDYLLGENGRDWDRINFEPAALYEIFTAELDEQKPEAGRANKKVPNPFYLPPQAPYALEELRDVYFYYCGVHGINALAAYVSRGVKMSEVLGPAAATALCVQEGSSSEGEKGEPAD